MEKKRVTGLGGVFFKCKNPQETKEWYATHLGLNIDQYGAKFEWLKQNAPTETGTTVWSPFKEETKYFEPSQKEYMFNYIVEDLEWLLQELKKEGIEQVGEMQEYEGLGKFAHILDPDGNKIELWEPKE